MAQAKVRSLKVRPIQSVDLAFEVDGVLGEQNFALAELSVQVTKFDLEAFYAGLSQTVAGNDGRLKFDSKTIHDTVQASLLFGLRAEGAKALLDKAVNLRESAFLQKYAKQDDIIAQIRIVNAPNAANPGAKPARLQQLLQITEKQHKELNDAYVADGRISVVRDTTNAAQGKTDVTSSSDTATTGHVTGVAKTHTDGTSTSQLDSNSSSTNMIGNTHTDVTTRMAALAIKTSQSPVAATPFSPGADKVAGSHLVTVWSNTNLQKVDNGVVPADNPAAGDWHPGQIQATQDLVNLPLFFKDSKWQELQSETPTFISQVSASDTKADSANPGLSTAKGHSDGKSTASSDATATTTEDTTGTAHGTGTSESISTLNTVSRGYDYRHPAAENDARFQRTQINVQDEALAQFIFSQQLPFLETIFGNELKSMDLDVKRLQLNYLNTLLLPPISGVVTGMYKDLGDCVKAGEPVMRVENDEEILVVGTIIFRGLLALGKPVTITTDIFDSPFPITVKGTIVSIRGHDSEDEEWDVIIRCGNRNPDGSPILPINYNFDYDDTTVTIG